MTEMGGREMLCVEGLRRGGAYLVTEANLEWLS
jgi:hypothetical protein